MVGLRGVGKTVLLDRMREDADASEAQTLRIEAPERRSLPAMLAPELRQALLRLGKYLNDTEYTRAGLTVARTLLSDEYVALSSSHQGLLLHSVYHRPNGWDHVPDGRKVPCEESSMWGDYHLLELGVYLQRLVRGQPYLTFFDPK